MSTKKSNPERDAFIRSQLPFCLERSDLSFLGEMYQGKVRDSYVVGDKRVLITSDRLSVFDVVLTTIPFKGRALTELALYWFDQTKDLVKNYVEHSPHPNCIVGKNCKVIPIEVIVRGFLTGSAYRDYTAGKAISGITLPKGMKKSQRFEEPLLTPSTKAKIGDHDMPISEAEIVKEGIVPEHIWKQVRDASMKLFKKGQEISEQKGLYLADTKYEFGLLGDEVILVDEIHTMDSSRYLEIEGYQERFEKEEDQKMLDKEPIRQLLISKGYMGEGKAPEFTEEYRIEIANHYINSFEKISGRPFNLEDTSHLKTDLEEALRGVFA